jgi:hypothetical protein
MTREVKEANGPTQDATVPLAVRIPPELDALIDQYWHQLDVDWLREHGTNACRTDAVKSLLTAGLRNYGIERK